MTVQNKVLTIAGSGLAVILILVAVSLGSDSGTSPAGQSLTTTVVNPAVSVVPDSRTASPVAGQAQPSPASTPGRSIIQNSLTGYTPPAGQSTAPTVLDQPDIPAQSSETTPEVPATKPDSFDQPAVEPGPTLPAVKPSTDGRPTISLTGGDYYAEFINIESGWYRYQVSTDFADSEPGLITVEIEDCPPTQNSWLNDVSPTVDRLIKFDVTGSLDADCESGKKRLDIEIIIGPARWIFKLIPVTKQVK